MPLLSGQMNFFRMSFAGNFNFTISEIIEKLDEVYFDKLFSNEKQLNYGFVPFGYPQIDDFYSSDINYGEFQIFSLRIDEVRLNSRFFDIEFVKQKKKFMADNKKEKISKADIEFIKNAVKNSLLMKSSPSSTIVDIILNSVRKEIFISSISTKIVDIVTHLFRSVFDVEIFQENITELFKKSGIKPHDIDMIMQLMPVEF